METTKRRNFVQRIACVFGGLVGASAIQRSTTAAPSVPVPVPMPNSGAIRLHLECRHHNRSSHKHGRMVCGGEILDKAGGTAVGDFHANCFRSESTFGAPNPFAASNIEMHTIRLADGVIFGMGANHSQKEQEKAHAIIGGTGRFAGARGTYVITENAEKVGGSQLTISLLA